MPSDFHRNTSFSGPQIRSWKDYPNSLCWFRGVAATTGACAVKTLNIDLPFFLGGRPFHSTTRAVKTVKSLLFLPLFPGGAAICFEAHMQ